MAEQGRTGMRGRERSLPPVGTKLTGRSQGKLVSATIVPTPQFPQGMGVKVGGRVYRTLSAAARHITGYSVNGWIFWKR